MRLTRPSWAEWRSAIITEIETAVPRAGIKGFRGITGEDDALRLEVSTDKNAVEKMPHIKLFLTNKSFLDEVGDRHIAKSYTLQGTNIKDTVEKARDYSERVMFAISIFDSRSDRIIEVAQAINAWFRQSGTISTTKGGTTYYATYILGDFSSYKNEDQVGNILYFRTEIPIEIKIESSSLSRDRVLKAIAEVETTTSHTITEIGEDETDETNTL